MARKNLKFDMNPLLGGPTLEARAKSGSPYRLLPLSDIDADPEQPRRSFETESLAELAASIKEFGVLSPILVRVTAGGTYRVVAGERRLRACRLLGLDTIPAIIDADDSENQSILAKQLVENIQRQDLSPLEKGHAMAQLRDKHALSVRDISKRLGVSKSSVQRTLDLLTLPEELKQALANGASESKVLLLAQVGDAALRKELLSQLESLSREALESKIRALSGDGEDEVSHRGTRAKSKKGKASLSTEDRRIIDELQRSLRIKVQLLRAKKRSGQGKLVLEFYSADDLDEIYKKLTS